MGREDETVIPKKRNVFYTTKAAFPTSGLSEGDLAFATDEEKLYRWDGSSTWDEVASNRYRVLQLWMSQSGSETLYVDRYIQTLYNNATNYLYSHPILIPDDFSSLVGAYIVGKSSAAGNVVVDAHANFGADGEAYNNHSASMGATVVTLPAANSIKVWDISSILSSLAGGDWLSIYAERQGSHASDTQVGDWGICCYVVYL